MAGHRTAALERLVYYNASFHRTKYITGARKRISIFVLANFCAPESATNGGRSGDPYQPLALAPRNRPACSAVTRGKTLDGKTLATGRSNEIFLKSSDQTSGNEEEKLWSDLSNVLPER